MPPEEIFYDMHHNVLWSPDGLGADDRAGVFIILQIIRSGLRPHIIFTTDEEVGAVGAAALAKKDCPFKDLRYMIELDRHGTNDCVFYDCDNREFAEYVESFGFISTWGSFSDISVLCPEWEVAGVNLSVGYRDEHSVSEVLFVNPLLATLNKVKKMLTEKDIPKFEYIFSYTASDYYMDRKCWAINDVLCSQCHKIYMEEELFPVKGNDGHYHYYCPECIATNVSWCKQCYQAFEANNPKAIVDICPDCKRKDNPNAV